jgi:CheY-like chemotaxis protein
MKTYLDAYGMRGGCFESLDAIPGDVFHDQDEAVLWVVDQRVMGQTESWQAFLSECEKHYGNGELPLIGTYEHPGKGLSSTTQSLAKPFFFEQLLQQAIKLLAPTRQETRRSKIAASSQEQESLLGLSILVAEDHPINCKLARLYLAKLGCECQVVHDGNEVLEVYEKQRFDAVLMDLHMPGMDGFETTRHLLDRDCSEEKPPYVIALTAGASSHEKAKAAEVGMKDFLLKPVRIEQLREALQGAVAK